MRVTMRRAREVMADMDGGQNEARLGSTPSDLETAGSILGHLQPEFTRLRAAMETAGLFRA
jgi:hypothetical protein